MDGQISITVSPDLRKAIDDLAALQGRSRSQMGRLLIEQRLAQLRQEYRAERHLSSLPSQGKTNTRGWNKECIEKFGK